MLQVKPERYRRNTAFLYPDLEKCTPGERLNTLQLIAQITAKVTSANNTLMELIDGGNFSFVNCMPTVHMECVSDASITPEDYENVRICVSQFDQHDYTAGYKDLVNAYRTGMAKISHLVALNITSRPQKTSFSEDKNKQFDTIVTLNLNHLESILVSIMFDISIYHYFGLSNDLPDRKQFNEIKFTYLSNKYDFRFQSENYGQRFPQNPIYLPGSLPEVRKLKLQVGQENSQKIVKDMLDSFATFLAESSIAIHIEKDSDGDMVGPHSLLPSDLSDQVQKIIRKYKNSPKFAIIFLKDSTGNIISKVVECLNNGNFPCWIEKSDEMHMLYKIVSVKQGGEEI